MNIYIPDWIITGLKIGGTIPIVMMCILGSVILCIFIKSLFSNKGIFPW